MVSTASRLAGVLPWRSTPRVAPTAAGPRLRPGRSFLLRSQASRSIIVLSVTRNRALNRARLADNASLGSLRDRDGKRWFGLWPTLVNSPRVVAARGFLFYWGMMSTLIRVAGLHYTYGLNTATPIEALRGIDLEIARGEYLAIVGHNGSGKSTLAKCLNGLLLPTRGEVWVEGWSTSQPEALLDIRATVGMVFQNPDNQIIASVLEEEVAFGPENLGIPRQELRQRVDQALQDAGLWELRERAPHTLSAGQKARLAIASILAMRPACLVLDESTAMLDPLSRREILALVRQLHRDGLTIVMITHCMDEVLDADRVLVLEQGRIVLQGTPREVFAQPERLQALGLGLPPAAAIAQGLRQRGVPLPANILTAGELLQAVTASVGVRP